MDGKMKVLGLGVALGLTWAIGMLFLGLMAWWFNWGTEMVNMLGSLYIGYAPTFIGTIIGTIWGFIDCFIAGVLIALFYNRFT